MSRGSKRTRIHWTTDCPTGKRRYQTRADARAALKSKPHTKRWQMDQFECPSCHGFHNGHLPTPVVKGELARDEIFRPLADGE